MVQPKSIKMKNILSLILLMLFSFSYSQSNICVKIDEFEDTKSYSVNTRVVTDLPDDKTKGIVWDVYFKEDKKGNVKMDNLMLSVIGLSCIEQGSELFVIFEDGEKITLTNWNKFNCDDNWWSVFNDKLFTTKIKKVKFTNKQNYKSYIFDVSGKELSDFFINLHNDVNEGNTNGFEECK